VLSNAIQFGNQTAWIKGSGNALFTTSNGSNTIPVLAQAFTVYDPNNIGVIRNIGLDSNGVLTAQRTNTHPSDFRVSSIILGTSPLTTDGTDLFLNGSNIGSSNIATWANYPAINTIQGTALQFSNNSPSIGLIDTTYNPSDPRSTSVFLNPYQFVMTAKYSVNRNFFRLVNSSNSFTIQNDTGGTNIYTSGTLQNGDPSQIFIQSDVSMTANGKFTGISTLTKDFTVSTININNNRLTASNGALYFNGSVVNSSNSADIWATFPATSNINAGSNQMSNVTIVKSANYNNAIQPGFILDQTLGGVINGSQGLFVTTSADAYNGNAITTLNGNIEAQSGPTIPHYVVSSNGFAHQAPNGTSWFRTKVDGTSGQMTIAKMSATTPLPLSTATVYDTIYNPLPSYPIVYFGPQNSVISYNFTSAGPSQYVVISPLGTFTPTTNQGLVSFSVVVPSAYSNAVAHIGIGPVGTYFNSETFLTYVGPRDPVIGGYFQRMTMLCDFTGYLGSNFNWRMAGNFNATFAFQDCYYKPLPN
jgi:hypothetical protein